MNQIKRGFTLIELLIVVAIIAILAAIAVPNFLEAQTRSKVSRCKADQRSLATALESYRVDNNNYPYGFRMNIPSLNHMSFLNRLKVLTSPIAYTTSVPNDIFNQYGEVWANTPLEEMKTFDYTRKEDVMKMTGDWPYDWYSQQGQPVNGQWVLRGWGPDKLNGRMTGWVMTPKCGPIPYDPTNGTISAGDLTLWGPGLGWGL